jgi:hypothetical protein
MNAAAFIGRCTAGIIASYTGVLNLTIVSAVACSALIISMVALSDIANVTILSVIYGYFSGVCMSHTAIVVHFCALTIKDVSLLVPLITFLTPDLSELGLAS